MIFKQDQQGYAVKKTSTTAGITNPKSNLSLLRMLFVFGLYQVLILRKYKKELKAI